MTSFLPLTSYNFELQAAANGNRPGPPVTFNRDPVDSDVGNGTSNYNLGQQWFSTSSLNTFVLTALTGGVATWVQFASSAGALFDLDGDTGTATPSTGTITIAGGTGITTAAASSTVTIDLDSPVSVANGGTGAATLTGVLIGNGTGAFTAQAPLGVANGGIGVATLTGLPLFAGTAAATAVAYTPVTAWTPNLQINGSSVGITYTTQEGFYQRIGSIVFVNCVIELSSKGASNGIVSISNMPVLTGAQGDLNHFIVSHSNVTLTADYTDIDLGGNVSSAVFDFSQIGSGEGIATLTDAELANTSAIFFSGFYFVN